MNESREIKKIYITCLLLIATMALFGSFAYGELLGYYYNFWYIFVSCAIARLLMVYVSGAEAFWEQILLKRKQILSWISILCYIVPVIICTVILVDGGWGLLFRVPWTELRKAAMSLYLTVLWIPNYLSRRKDVSTLESLLAAVIALVPVALAMCLGRYIIGCTIAAVVLVMFAIASKERRIKWRWVVLLLVVVALVLFLSLVINHPWSYLAGKIRSIITNGASSPYSFGYEQQRLLHVIPYTKLFGSVYPYPWTISPYGFFYDTYGSLPVDVLVNLGWIPLIAFVGVDIALIVMFFVLAKKVYAVQSRYYSILVAVYLLARLAMGLLNPFCLHVYGAVMPFTGTWYGFIPDSVVCLGSMILIRFKENEFII